MEIKYRIYTTMARLVPKKYKKHLERMLVYAGEKRSVNFWIGSASVLAVLVFVIAILSQTIFFPIKEIPALETIPLAFPFFYVILALISFLIVQFLVYIVIYFKAIDRTKRVEEALPDALQLMSANLKAGMTPFQAMKLAARKEFGPLKEEIEYATTKALGTESFSKALLSIAKRIQSPILDRAMKLFAASMKSGGHLAQLLEDLANDIAETKTLKKELITSTKMYSMLILFMVVIGAPLLLSVSIYFIKIISNMQAASGTAEAGFGMAFLAGTINLTPDFITKLSIIILFVTAVLASMLMGVIKEGKEKYGLKYAPLVITASLIVFAATEYIISSLLGI
ncbi:type II secretion system F family protein [Candidatus Woesearchaeota archaeon]|nr:type II secretion system F family protein [Candidatus Woesearchaeota archaeon]